MAQRWEKDLRTASNAQSKVCEYDLTYRVMHAGRRFDVCDHNNLILYSSANCVEAVAAAVRLAKTAHMTGSHAIVCTLQANGDFKVEWSS